MNSFLIKLVAIFAGVHSLFVPISCDLRDNCSVPFDEETWNSFDVGMYDERRYNMAIWFFEEDWFNGKTKETILNELCDNNCKGMEKENPALFELKYSNEFRERWNIDYYPKPTAYLRIYFNENSQTTKADLLTGNKRMELEEFKLIKTWKK